MSGTFGTPEINYVRTIEETFNTAVQHGYLEQLQAYGVGKGLSREDAEVAMLENRGLPIHRQLIEDYQYLRKEVDSARNKQNYLNSAVSMGDDKVKGKSSPIFPADNPAGEPPPNGKNSTGGTE